MIDETDLQRRLARLADSSAPPHRRDLADVVVARHRTQRRQTLGLAAVAAVVAAVVLAVPTVVGGAPPGPPSAAGPAAPVDVLAAPTRGSLAGDAGFVEGVRQLAWTGSAPAGADVPDVPVDRRRVVFAGDVAGARWALVVGADPDGGSAAAWFAGPAGAAPERLVPETVLQGVDPTLPVALSDAGTGALVVLAAPGDVVEVSPGPEVAADGSTSRTWRPVEAPAGLAVLASSPAGSPHDPGLRYRVTRGDVELVSAAPWTRSDETATPPGVPVGWLRAPAPSPADAVLPGAAAQVLGRLGLPADQVSFSVAWAGDVPAPAERTARVHLLTATLPSGAVYTEALLSSVVDDGSVVGTACGSGLQAAGPALLDRTHVVRCDATSPSGRPDVVSSLVVVAPADATSGRALDLGGAVLAEFPLTDGVAVLPFPERAATVESLTGNGTVLQSTRPLTSADLED